MTNEIVCMRCGHPRTAHMQDVTKLGRYEKVVAHFEKALSECPGFDSGDADADTQVTAADFLQEEQKDFEGRRPGRNRDTHWD